MVIRKLSIAALAACCTLGATRADATKYYVSPIGNATNAGTTSSAPWSMSKANSALLPGDIAVLAPGSYSTNIAPARGGTSYSKFIAYVGNLSTPSTTVVPGVTLGSGSSARPFVSIKGVEITSSQTTLTAPNDSIAWCHWTNGVLAIGLGGDDCTVAHCVLDGMKVDVAAGPNAETPPLVARDTLYACAFNLFMDGYGPAFRVLATDGINVNRCRFIVTVGPDGDHGMFKMYGGRRGKFTDCLFDFTNTRTTACDECGMTYFRDFSVQNVFQRDTFLVRGPNYNAVLLSASGTWPGTTSNNRYESCVFRNESPGVSSAIFWQDGARGDTLRNCVVVGNGNSGTPFNSNGLGDGTVVDHNTFVYLGTNGTAGDVEKSSGLAMTNNIFYSPNGGKYALIVQPTVVSSGNYTGDYNLLFNNGSGKPLYWGSNGLTNPGALGSACTGSGDECHSAYGDPLFVGGADVFSFDAHLKAGSPAIAAALGGLDVGALAYGTGSIDAIAPSRIANLSITQTGNDNAQLGWTAPGDDGSTGRATLYELRLSSAPITDANFTLASIVTITQAPRLSGSPESFVVNGLTGAKQYYFAIRAVDDAGNRGLVSNSPMTTTLASDTIAPAQIKDLNAGP